MNILDEIKKTTGRNTFEYKFFLNCCCSSSGTFFRRKKEEPIRGRVIDKGEDWVRVRQRETVDGAHTDILIPLHAICKIQEDFFRE